jgi:hypothetical protein
VMSNDTLAEGLEWFHVSLANVTGALMGANSNATIWILDNDVTGTVSFNASEYFVNEADSSVTVTINRTGGTASGVGVDFQTVTESAAPGADYVQISTNIVFALNETSRRIVIPIFNDGLIESNETVILRLSNPRGGALLGSPSTARLTISDVGTPSSGPPLMAATITNISGSAFFTDFSALTALSATYSSNAGTITMAGHEFISDPQSIVTRELTEDLSFSAVAIDGPGIFPIAASAQITFDYLDQTNVLGQNQINVDNHYAADPSDVSILAVDVFDLQAAIISGRFELILTDLNNAANKIHVQGSFRIPLNLQ